MPQDHAAIFNTFNENPLPSFVSGANINFY